MELFRLIDVHDEMALNDVQFCAFMQTATDLNANQIYKVFDMLDGTFCEVSSDNLITNS